MQEIKVDVDLSKNLDQITRDAGMGYIQEPDGQVVRQWPWINKLCHQKTKDGDLVDQYLLPFVGALAVVAIVTAVLFLVDLYS